MPLRAPGGDATLLEESGQVLCELPGHPGTSGDLAPVHPAQFVEGSELPGHRVDPLRTQALDATPPEGETEPLPFQGQSNLVGVRHVVASLTQVVKKARPVVVIPPIEMGLGKRPDLPGGLILIFHDSIILGVMSSGSSSGSSSGVELSKIQSARPFTKPGRNGSTLVTDRCRTCPGVTVVSPAGLPGNT